jgi:hypothetical protein
MEQLFSESELQAIASVLADTSEGLAGTEIGRTLASLKMADRLFDAALSVHAPG